MVLKEMSKPQPHPNVDRWLAGVADTALAIHVINLREIWLAATALVHGLVVVTRNVRDFRGRGVPLLDPFRTPPRPHA